MIAFTICQPDSIAAASALHESFVRHHPGAGFYVALSERATDIEGAALPFTVLALPELGLPDPGAMAARYEPSEMRAAMKPFAFQVIFDQHPGAGVLYLDPWVLVMSRLEELLDLADGGAHCVLTPTLTEPAEHADFRESLLLERGVYDLGFCFLADGPDARRIVWWWARRLETDRRIDPEVGPMLDQRWPDLFPAFIDATRILRHPGYGLSVRNRSQRRLARTPAGWVVNGLPLRFVSFDGMGGHDGTASRKDSSAPDPRTVDPMATLLAEFQEAVGRHEHSDVD